MMRRFRSQMSYANVVASLALFLALGGTSFAAVKLITGKNVKDSSLTGRDIRNGTLTGGDVRDKSLTARDFKGSIQGAKGDPGATGTAGQQGLIGATGATGANGAGGVFAGGVSGLSATSPGGTSVARGPVNGTATSGPGLIPFSALSPGRPIRVRDLSADVVTDVTVGSSVTIEFIAHAPSDYADPADPGAVSCTITGTAGSDDKRCSSSASVVVDPGSVIFMRLTTTVAVAAPAFNPTAAHWGITVEPVG